MKQALTFLTLFVYKTVESQNIVSNGSYEDVNICTEFHQSCSPSGWFYINHLVRGYGISASKTTSGEKDLNLLVVDTGSSRRDYWQTILLCPLETGKVYKVSLQLASNFIGPNLHDIGLYFSNGFLFFSKDSVIQPANYLNFLDARITKLKNGWFEVEKEFTATSAYHYLMIGNFSGKTNKQITKERGLRIKQLYLSVDDLYISSTKVIACPERQKIKDSLYSVKERHFQYQFHDSSVSKPEIPARVNIDTIMISNIEFDFDSYQIKNPDKLHFLRNYLLDTTVKKIKITGFTDTTGSMHYNKSLSEKRAKAVARFLVTTLGLKESGIETEGKGISTLFADAQQNRRVEIYIYH